MHVCLVSTYFPRPCGIASYSHYLAGALVSSHVSPRLTLLAERPAEPASNERFTVIPAFSGEEDYTDELVQHIEAIDPDVVHIQHEYGIFGYDNRFPTLLRRLRDLRRPTLVTLHTVHTRLSFNAGCARPEMRRLLRAVDIEAYQRTLGVLADSLIVHQSKPIRQVLLRQGLVPDRVVAIQHGTLVLPRNQIGAKQQLGLDEDTKLIVAFGYFEPSKNLLRLIRAFHQVRHCVGPAKLWLGGHVRFATGRAVAYRDHCRRLIESLSLGHDVIFADEAVPEEQVPRLLAAADVACFVYNEDTYSSSGALHRAMGMGLPIIASRIPKFQELAEVSDEILVTPGSVGALSRLLVRTLHDDTFRSSIVHAVRRYARHTAWPVVALKHWSLYRRLSPGVPHPSRAH